MCERSNKNKHIPNSTLLNKSSWEKRLISLKTLCLQYFEVRSISILLVILLIGGWLNFPDLDVLHTHKGSCRAVNCMSWRQLHSPPMPGRGRTSHAALFCFGLHSTILWLRFQNGYLNQAPHSHLNNPQQNEKKCHWKFYQYHKLRSPQIAR